MIIILLLGGIALFWFITIMVACLVVSKTKSCNHIWIKDSIGMTSVDRCFVCKKIK